MYDIFVNVSNSPKDLNELKYNLFNPNNNQY